MRRTEFDSLTQDLAAYYERKAPNGKSGDLWYEKVRNIPSDSIEWIAKAITDRSETFPKNLPNILWAFYQEWLRSHPEKKAIEEDRGCKHNSPKFGRELCSDGLLYVWKNVEALGYNARYVFRCVDCKRSNLTGIPEASLFRLIETGYQAEEPEHDKKFGKQFSKKGLKDKEHIIPPLDGLTRKIMEQHGWI